MGKMLLCVPRMYTEDEFRRIETSLPGDFELKTSEFWDYVKDKFQMFVGKVQRVYRDEICQGEENALAYLSSVDRENYLIAKSLIESGAVFEATEDPMLVSESESWLEMIEHEPLNQIYLELYQETIRDRDKYISNRINESLGEDELGVLFIEPSRRINLNEHIKIIKVCRFDPSDYLRSWQVQIESKQRLTTGHDE